MHSSVKEILLRMWITKKVTSKAKRLSLHVEAIRSAACAALLDVLGDEQSPLANPGAAGPARRFHPHPGSSDELTVSQELAAGNVTEMWTSGPAVAQSTGKFS